MQRDMETQNKTDRKRMGNRMTTGEEEGEEGKEGRVKSAAEKGRWKEKRERGL